MRTDEDIRRELDGASNVEVLKPKPATKGKANGHEGGDRELGFELGDWEAERAFAGEARPISWLVSDAIPTGVVGLVAAAGDTGKSYLLLDLCERVARGFRQDMQAAPIFGGYVADHGAAVFITAEDSKAAVHRRLRALDPDGARLAAAKARGTAHPLHVVPLPDAGGPFPLVEQARSGIVVTPRYERLRERLLAIPGLKLVVLDPLQAFVLADVNADPMAAQFVCSLLARLAAESGATVLVAHHVRKEREPPRTPEEARAAIRGTSALVDGVRVAVALWLPSEDAGKTVCRVLKVDHRPAKIACGAVVKTNDGASRKVWTMVRADHGLLVDRTGLVAARMVAPEELLARLQAGIAAAAVAGRPLTKTGENGIYARRAELGEALATVARGRLELMLDELERAGRVVRALANGTVAKWLDVQDGPFARGEGAFTVGASRSRPGRKGPADAPPAAAGEPVA